MIYLVTLEQKLFENPEYKTISVEESLQLMKDCKVLQYDSETTGRDARICNILCIQFGNKEKDFQIVVDCTTIDITIYKDILEGTLLIGQNLKFDLQFLYNHGIVPRNVYDTMIVEQLLYLGYPAGIISFSLAAIAQRRLGIDIDKSIRGQIIWRGLDTQVIIYAANDVKWLEDIMWSQVADCKKKDCLKGAKLECDFVPVISYLEWCGIKLDEKKWKAKMVKDKESLISAEDKLNEFVTSNPSLSKFTIINRQGNLFEGFDTEPKCTINWSSSRQVVEVAKILGFNTTVQDKKTKEDKDSVLEKHLKGQKGINDEFLKLYFDYQEHAKVVSSFGQSQLNMINPKTGRCHTVYKQLGASSGRMSCGSQQPNEDLAKLKKIRPKECTYCNFQQLPADDDTRGSFVSEKDNIFCSCDYSAMESYLGADIYEDIEFQNEFLYGSKDTHSLFAWMVFRKECEALGCTCVADVKKKAPQWRKAVKAVEFAYMFGAAAPTIAQSANCSVEQAQEYIDRLDKGFTGISRFAREGSKFVRKNGYVLINKYTGHKMYWWDHDKWLERQKSFTSEFWDEYKAYHKGTTSRVALEVREHFQAASKWDRMARNAPTQGSGACITKLACTNFFNWIIDNNLFDKVKIVAIVHDEVCIEYPKELEDTYKMLEYHMEEASKAYCKFSKIPAKAEIGLHWIH
jgi:DNA polymerase I-like protein with 3'-5' exonuclease and polymerase domains